MAEAQDAPGRPVPEYVNVILGSGDVDWNVFRELEVALLDVHPEDRNREIRSERLYEKAVKDAIKAGAFTTNLPGYAILSDMKTSRTPVFGPSGDHLYFSSPGHARGYVEAAYGSDPVKKCLSIVRMESAEAVC